MTPERGSALIEVAVLVPILITLVFGVIFFSQWFKTKAVAQAAAREGARTYAVTGDLGASRQQIAKELAAAGLNPAEAEIHYEAVGYSRRATVLIKKRLVLPLLVKEVTLRGEAVFNAER